MIAFTTNSNIVMQVRLYLIVSICVRVAQLNQQDWNVVIALPEI